MRKAGPTRIWGSVKLTCNLGNYESLHAEFGAELAGADKAALTEELTDGINAVLKEFIDTNEIDFSKAGQVAIHFSKEATKK